MLTLLMIAILGFLAFFLRILPSLRLAHRERMRSESVNIESSPLTYQHRDTHDALQRLMEVVDEALFFRNLTSGAFTSFNFDAKQGTTLVGNSTERIVEAPTVDNSQTQIAAYGEVFFSARQPGFGSHRSVAAMLGLLSTLCPIAIAQKAPAALRDDPFIQAIETMKHAVAHVDCLGVSSALPELIERVGSSLFISEEGNFLTAAHVIQEIQRSKRCPNSAITLPAGDWRPEARTENMAWFPFNTSNCRVDKVLDIAVCWLSQDLSARRWELHLRAEPVAFDWNIPPDGTPVAFTGFPLRSRDPMTFRADVAAYRIPWAEEAIPELVLDHVSLPGFSGSPVYLADGKIVAILVKGGTGETNGIAIARAGFCFSGHDWKEAAEEVNSGLS